jgi:hypothetical protein
LIVTADELIIAFGWLAGAFTKKVLFETAQPENLGETTVLMNSQHSSQHFFIRWDGPFHPVGIPADFLDWLGYQLIFIIFFS